MQHNKIIYKINLTETNYQKERNGIAYSLAVQNLCIALV